MMRYRLKRHRYKIVVGVPMAVLLASSLSLVRNPEEVCIVPEDNRFVEVGETVTLHLTAEADEPINVIGATVTAPSDYVEFTGTDRTLSIIDLWSEEPRVEDGRVTFSGGIVSADGFLGTGVVLAITAVPLQEGEAEVALEDVSMLAHDGTGKQVECAKNPITLFIRPSDHPSPDVNNDNSVNIIDFGIVSARLFMSYEKSYDLNKDGRITLADVGIVISNMAWGGSEQSSLALLFGG